MWNLLHLLDISQMKSTVIQTVIQTRKKNAHAHIDPQIYACNRKEKQKKRTHHVTVQCLVQTNTCKDVWWLHWKFTCLTSTEVTSHSLHIQLGEVTVECAKKKSSIVPVINVFGNSCLLLFPASWASCFSRCPAHAESVFLLYLLSFTLSLFHCLSVSLCILKFFPPPISRSTGKIRHKE